MSRDKELYKDEKNDQIKQEPSAIIMTLSLRAYWFKFLSLGAIVYFMMKILMEIPEKGYRIYDILGKPYVSEKTSRFWLKILSYRISYDYLVNPIYVIITIAVLLIIYYVILAKTTEYSINFRFLEIKRGVLNRTIDTIDLVHIQDQVIERSLIHRLLGISKLIILSKDKNTPELHIEAVDSKKAEMFINFIRQNAYQSSTEYWIAKDRRKRNENKKNNDNDINLNEGVDE